MIFCAVCFGDPASPLTQGFNAGVLVMLALTGVVLIVIATTFVRFVQKSRQSNQQ